MVKFTVQRDLPIELAYLLERAIELIKIRAENEPHYRMKDAIKELVETICELDKLANE